MADDPTINENLSNNENLSQNSSAARSRSTSFNRKKDMDFSSLAKNLSLNLTLKLDQSNHVYWKMQVLPAIRALDLEHLITSPNHPPEKAPEASSNNEKEVNEQEVVDDYLNWKKSDQLLMSWLLSTLSQSVYGQVTNCKTSFEVWSRIERVYAQRSMAKIFQLRQHLGVIKKGSDSINDFVMKIKAITDALLAAGDEVSERDSILTLVNGVGHEYDSVVTLVTSQQKSMSLEDAQFLFLMHEQRIEQLNVSAHLSMTNPSAQYASNTSNFNHRGGGRNNTNNTYRGAIRGRNRGGRSGGRSNQKLHCQLCSKPGHGAWQCYRRYDQQFQGGPAQGNGGGQNSHAYQGSQALMAQHHNYNSYEQGSALNTSNPSHMFQENVQAIPDHSTYGSYQNAAYFATPETVADQAWYVDTGATNHVTANMNNLSLKSDYRGSENQEGPTPRIS